MDAGVAVNALRDAARALIAIGDGAATPDAVRSLSEARNALDACLADSLASLNLTRAYESEGASSLVTWARREVQFSSAETHRFIAAAETMNSLPRVGEAASRGAIRLEHAHAFTYARRHVGSRQTKQAEPWLLDVALACEPKDLRDAVRELRAAVHPDELEQAWIAGMDRRDISLNRVPDGWHLTGFLDILTGTKFKQVLSSVSAPCDAHDERRASERRVEGFAQMLDSVLESGLPTDKGVRPQLNVLVDVETLSTSTAATPPAELVGFGSISSGLLAQLSCTSDITGITIDRNRPSHDTRHVLDVGRTRRLATAKQRRAVLIRQSFECGAPGCRHTHLEIHHITPWSEGGPSDMSNLIGLCSRCHHLVHSGRLTITRRGAEVIVRQPTARLISSLPRSELRHHAWRQRLARTG